MQKCLTIFIIDISPIICKIWLNKLKNYLAKEEKDKE